MAHTFSHHHDSTLYLERNVNGKPERLPAGSPVRVRDAVTHAELPGTQALALGYLDFTADVPSVDVSGDGGATWPGPFWSVERRREVNEGESRKLDDLLDMDSGKVKPALLPETSGDFAPSSVTPTSGARAVGRGEQAIDLTDYTEGDYTADDTDGVQEAINTAVASGRPLWSPAGHGCSVGPLTIDGPLQMVGELAFSPRVQDQPHVLSVSGQQDWSKATVSIGGHFASGGYKALYGVRCSDVRGSKFGRVSVDRAQVWGWQFEDEGNNNYVQFDQFNSTLCGQKSAQMLTCTNRPSNIGSSTQAYSTFSLSAPLPTRWLNPGSVYFVIVAGLAYKVRTVGATTIEVFNLDVAVGSTVSADVLIGGGLNFKKWGDSGVGAFGSLDISDTRGIGVHQASLYGHEYNNMVLQFNSIGWACSDFSQGTTFTKPYFEGNDVPWVSWNYVEGFMVAPVLDVAKIQNCIMRLRGQGYRDPRMVVIQNQLYGLASVPPVRNPGTVTLVPGMPYAYERSAISTWNFVIDNQPQYEALGAFQITLDLTHTHAHGSYPFNVTLGQSNGETIEGGSSFSTAVGGRTFVTIFKVGTDWKVNVHRPAAAIDRVTSAPAWVGQTAVVDGVAYIATGTGSTADWKQITA